MTGVYIESASLEMLFRCREASFQKKNFLKPYAHLPKGHDVTPVAPVAPVADVADVASVADVAQFSIQTNIPCLRNKTYPIARLAGLAGLLVRFKFSST
jgi:hypothetical protein